VNGAFRDASVDRHRSRFAAAVAGRYQVESEIGRGGAAYVFRARDCKNDRVVAIKILRPDLTGLIGDERFLREIRVASALTHPHILPILDSDKAGDTLYCVMPFLEGESLRVRMTRERQLSLTDALQIVRDVGGGLQYAHEAGLVHRDVKPENILLAGRDGPVERGAYLADFGLALLATAQLDERLTESGMAVGTVAYMSPEQSSGSDRIDARTDQYSLACVLFEMLAGVPPYPGSDARTIAVRHRLDPVPRLRNIRESIPAGVDEAVARAMSKTPADRFKSVGAFVEALSDAMADDIRLQYSGPTTLVSAASLGLERPWRKRGLIVVGLAAAAAIAAAVRFAWPTVFPSRIDDDVIAVAPFSTTESALGIWREGLVDMLYRGLDEAGPIRAVSPTTVLRQWQRFADSNTKADRASTAELARRTGARYGVFGALVRSGGDSVRATASVFDVATSAVLAQFDVRDDTLHMGRLGDSLTVSVLRAIGSAGRAHVAELRLASAGHAANLLALKEFLQGEHHFRLAAWDSALTHYRRSLAADSTNPILLSRLSVALRWQGLNNDPDARAYALRADQFNHGLAPRDSLMVAAGALLAKVTLWFADSTFWNDRARLFSTLETATQRYPNEADAWYELGDAHYRTDANARAALDAFDRAIRIDSSFAPAYPNAVILAMALRGPADAQRYLRAYLALNPTDAHASGFRLAATLLNGAPWESSQVQRFLGSASADLIQDASSVVAYWPDSGETAVRFARVFASGLRSTTAAYSDSSFISFQVAHYLAFRGHLHDAVRTLGTTPMTLARVPGSQYLRGTIVATLMMMGAAPDADARRFFSTLARAPVDQPTGLIMALPWWSARGDTASLLDVALRAHDAAARGRGLRASYAGYVEAAARAYGALARHDSAAALAGLLALPAQGCMYPYCPNDRFVAAELLAAAGRYRQAANILDDVPNLYSPLGVMWRFRRAQVAEALHRDALALQEYGFVAGEWAHADPEFSAVVAQAAAGIDRLNGRDRSHAP